MYRLPNSSLSLNIYIWVSSGLTPLPPPVAQQLSVLKDPLRCSLNWRFSRNISHTLTFSLWTLSELCCIYVNACACACVCQCMHLLLTVKAHLALMNAPSPPAVPLPPVSYLSTSSHVKPSSPAKTCWPRWPSDWVGLVEV